jgi:hypothetical protein
MSVDELTEAIERATPSYAGRTGDWDGVLARARTDRSARSRDWTRTALLALAGVLALFLLWPGDDRDAILERARAALGRGPVVHLVLRSGSYEFYDLGSERLRRIPVERELWFDESRGLRQIERIEGRALDDVLYTAVGPEVAMQLRGLADVFREALSRGDADVADKETIDGREVHWIEFRVRYPEVGIPSYDEKQRVAVDAETYQPVIWRARGGDYDILRWETLPRGSGDFAARRTEDGVSGQLGGVTRVGIRSPAEAQKAMPNALWLGGQFQDLALSSIREVRYETGPWTQGRPSASVPGLELCYGSAERCVLTLAQTSEPHPMAGRGHGWRVTPPPGTLGLAHGVPVGYLARDGVYVTLLARNEEEVIAAAQALKPISAGSDGGR